MNITIYNNGKDDAQLLLIVAFANFKKISYEIVDSPLAPNFVIDIKLPHGEFATCSTFDGLYQWYDWRTN
jgi:hypothetical protein